MIHYKYAGSGYRDRLASGAPPQSRDFLVALYRAMLRIRMVELEIERRYHEDQMKSPVHLVIGQEATCVGAAAAMRREDQLYCTHRTHGCYLAKGGDLRAMMSELYCRANGCAGSRGGSMHLIDKAVGMTSTSAIVGGIVPIAAGAALAAQLKREDVACVVFFGEAANEEGSMSESLNFAVLKRLPLVFFCENNFYSVCTPLHKRQPITEMHRRAAGFGIRAEIVDGCNVLDVFDATRRAIQRARAGEGPTYIEAPVYRWRAHAGAGDDSQSGYRAVAEREAWQNEADPIVMYREYLAQLKLLDETGRAAIERELDAEIMAAFAHAIQSPNPVEADLFRHVYAMG